MIHYFDVDIATKYGVKEAVLLSNIHYWVEYNRANNQNYFDGRYWTFNSKKSFSELFPYMSERQIDYSLKKLIEEGLILTGNYNESSYDRTLWYALTEKGYSILRNCKIEQTNLQAPSDNFVEPIPNNKHTYNKPDNKHYKTIIQEKDNIPNTYMGNIPYIDKDKNAFLFEYTYRGEDMLDDEIKRKWFIEFRDYYPKKDSMDECCYWFYKTNISKHDFDMCMAGLKVFMRSSDWRKENGRYIPKAIKYLEENMWEWKRGR